MKGNTIIFLFHIWLDCLVAFRFPQIWNHDKDNPNFVHLDSKSIHTPYENILEVFSEIFPSIYPLHFPQHL